jgi:hypothetical protein
LSSFTILLLNAVTAQINNHSTDKQPQLSTTQCSIKQAMQRSELPLFVVGQVLYKKSK